MKVLKFGLVIAICFITALYYNIVSFDRGIVQSSDGKDPYKILAKVEEVEYIQVGDSYYVFWLTDDAAFLEKYDEELFNTVDAVVDMDEKSIIPGVGAAICAVIVLIFVGNDKRR